MAVFGLVTQEAALARQAPAPNPRQAEVAWGELAGFAVDKQISIELPDGVKLRGEVLAVRPESLVLDVQKSSRKKVHPLGQTEVPRADVREVWVIRHQSAIFRVLGGVLGGVGGTFAAGALTYVYESAAVALPAFLLLIPVSATAGYYAGKLADRRVTHIRIQAAVASAGEEEE
jgi:hypothetical protein